LKSRRASHARFVFRERDVRAIVQRVKSARVVVEGEETGAIDRGLLVYLAAGKDDTNEDADWLLAKILALRIFENDAGKMDKNVFDVAGALLIVSQFTLYGDVRRGNRPGFERAMPPDLAKVAYDSFVEKARTKITVATGRFRAHMNVLSDNDGPVTLFLESPKSESMNA
jgi:D-aminoacyl-tRNA deacylase